MTSQTYPRISIHERKEHTVSAYQDWLIGRKLQNALGKWSQTGVEDWLCIAGLL